MAMDRHDMLVEQVTRIEAKIDRINDSLASIAATSASHGTSISFLMKALGGVFTLLAATVGAIVTALVKGGIH